MWKVTWDLVAINIYGHIYVYSMTPDMAWVQVKRDSGISELKSRSVLL